MQTIAAAHERRLSEAAFRREKYQEGFRYLEGLFTKYFTPEVMADFFKSGQIDIHRVNEHHEHFHQLEIYADSFTMHQHVDVRVRFRLIARADQTPFVPYFYVNVAVRNSSAHDAKWEELGVSSSHIADIKIDSPDLLKNEKIGSSLIAAQTEIDRRIENARSLASKIGEGYDWQYVEQSRTKAEQFRVNVFLTPDEREAAFSKAMEFHLERKKAEEDRTLQKKLNELREARAKKRYDEAFVKWRDNGNAAFEDFVKTRFTPWSYRKISVIPRNVTIHVEYEGDDHEGQLEEAIAEALIFEYKVLSGPDDKGLYTILSGTEVKNIEIFGEVVAAEIVEFKDPYKYHANAKPFSPNIGGLFSKTAYFCPLNAPEKEAFVIEKAPVYTEFLAQEPMPTSLED